ncbi:MAG TPA: hypothetical protein VF772_07580, partial [Terriglobales bacterium]
CGALLQSPVAQQYSRCQKLVHNVAIAFRSGGVNYKSFRRLLQKLTESRENAHPVLLQTTRTERRLCVQVNAQLPICRMHGAYPLNFFFSAEHVEEHFRPRQ